MKKAIIFSLVTTLTSTVFAGIASWTAASDVAGSVLNNTFANGTAYFLEIKAGGPTIESMITTIKTSGLGTTNSNVINHSNSLIYVDSGAAYTDMMSFTPTLTEDASSYYCVLFVDANNQNFIFSNSQTSTDWIAVGANSQYDLTFLEDTTSPWVANAVGGGDTPGVPEPTAFALLALGVAGMALRRKVK